MGQIFSKYAREITESLRDRLEKLQQAVADASAFASKDNQNQPTLDTIIQKLEQKKNDPGQRQRCANSLEMLHELAQEEPTTNIRPQTIITLLQRKIMELKKAQAAMAELEV